MFLTEPGSKLKFTHSHCKWLSPVLTYIPAWRTEQGQVCEPKQDGWQLSSSSSPWWVAQLPCRECIGELLSSPPLAWRPHPLPSHAGYCPIHFLPRLISSCSLSPQAQQAPGKQLQVTQIVCGQGQPSPACKEQFMEAKALTRRKSQELSPAGQGGRGMRSAALGPPFGSRRQSVPGLQQPDRPRDMPSPGRWFNLHLDGATSSQAAPWPHRSAT